MLSPRISTASSSNKCPPGLECLLPTSALIIEQKVEFLEVLTGFEEENQYVIYNQMRDTVLWAQESSGLCARCCIPHNRPFRIGVFDMVNRREVLYLNKLLDCGFCCARTQQMQVYTSEGLLMGTLEERCVGLRNEFIVRDGVGEIVFFIEGAACWECCKTSFEVYSRNKQLSIGRIKKGWAGFMREFFTDADVFSITYPQDLEVKMKAVLLGAVFLINHIYFENNAGCGFFD